MSIKLDRRKLASGLFARPLDKVNFNALLGLELARCLNAGAFVTVDVYADKGIGGCYTACGGVSTGGAYLRARDRKTWWLEDAYTCYWSELAAARTTSDHGLWKTVAGTATQLATEAVDLTAEERYPVFLSCYGTTIKSGRGSLANYRQAFYPYTVGVSYDGTPIVVTDTSIASGAFGMWDVAARYGNFPSGQSYWQSSWVNPLTLIIRDEAAGSPMLKPPEPLAYFEVPVEFFDLPEFDEHGNVNLTRQFYGVKMPEEIVELPKPVPEWVRRKKEVLERKGWSEEEIRAFLPEAFPVERINRLALTTSALIPTDGKGKPKNSTAIVRIFGGSPEYVHPIEKRIQAVKEMRGVRQLKREEAISLALKMDDKLHIHDLVPCTKHDLGGKCFKEYREWRIYTVGDKEEFADTDARKSYVKEGKGW